MDNIFLDNLAEFLFEFLVIAKNNIINEDEFIKNFPNGPCEVQKYLDKYPMPPSHVKVIIYLSRVKNASISQIASTLNISKSNTTPIIDKLISYDLITRYTDSNDRRVVRVELTPLALSIFDDFKNIIKNNLIEKLISLSDEELQETQDCILRLTSIFKKI